MKIQVRFKQWKNGEWDVYHLTRGIRRKVRYPEMLEPACLVNGLYEQPQDREISDKLFFAFYNNEYRERLMKEHPEQFEPLTITPKKQISLCPYSGGAWVGKYSDLRIEPHQSDVIPVTTTTGAYWICRKCGMTWDRII